MVLASIDWSCCTNLQNLSDSVDNTSLQELFSKFGDVISCKIIRNEDGTSRGYGFVQFASQEPADAAIQSLNNSHFGDRQLYVLCRSFVMIFYSFFIIYMLTCTIYLVQARCFFREEK
jgi:hypothetical protein